MTESPGNYPIERRDGEIDRLQRQGAAMAPDCEAMLERIGVGEGWRSLDLGCGPEGITPLLAARVGTTGKVIGLDADQVFVDYARQRAAPNTLFLQGNAYGSDLPAGSFDLVHLRFVASTAGDPAALLHEAMRLARPGGFVEVQYRPFLIGVRSSDAIADYLPATVESLRRTILTHELMSESELDIALAACRAHLANPGTVFTLYTVVQVWGRVPG